MVLPIVWTERNRSVISSGVRSARRGVRRCGTTRTSALTFSTRICASCWRPDRETRTVVDDGLEIHDAHRERRPEENLASDIEGRELEEATAGRCTQRHRVSCSSGSDAMMCSCRGPARVPSTDSSAAQTARDPACDWNTARTCCCGEDEHRLTALLRKVSTLSQTGCVRVAKLRRSPETCATTSSSDS